MARPARSNGLDPPAPPSTASRAPAGRCARSGRTRGGASRSWSPPGQWRPSPRSSASASTSLPPRPSR